MISGLLEILLSMGLPGAFCFVMLAMAFSMGCSPLNSFRFLILAGLKCDPQKDFMMNFATSVSGCFSAKDAISSSSDCINAIVHTEQTCRLREVSLYVEHKQHGVCAAIGPPSILLLKHYPFLDITSQGQIV